jgi:hypothetical protein
MDESFQCDCGNKEFWFFLYDAKIRCTKCYDEYGTIINRFSKSVYKRKFNKQANKYEGWEPFINEKIEQ